ncbi:hypothetical protein GJAV_G00188760 [Gymnothorax javanicus]|nr:hypothetical protein GJAV_G00188760 [Gymnothorax javanicus]
MSSPLCLMVMFSSLIGISIGKACPPSEYSSDAEECCPMCSEGSVVHKDCTLDTSTTCIPCVKGVTYMDEPNGLTKCIPCKTCDPGQGFIYLQECTTTRNTFCNVKDGFYCQKYSKNKECNFAIKHSTCIPGQYLKVPGTKTADTQCEDCPDGSFSAHGVNCTVWRICNSDQQKTAEGTNTKDTVCEDKPVRSRAAAVASALLFGAVVFGLCYTGLKNTLKIPVQETGEPLRPAVCRKGDGTGCAETDLPCPPSLQ